jgi:ABC-2 type transport system permease protein
MSSLGALVGIGLKNNFSLVRFWRQIKYNQRRWRTVWLGALIAVGLSPLIYSYILMIRSMYMLLHSIGQESALVILGVITGQMVIFILGFLYVISVFYFSNDLEMLIPLPLRPRAVVFSKLVVVLVNEYVLLIPFALPLLLGYGILSRAPIDYWIFLAPVYLLLPVIPLAISALVAFALMRVVNLSRKKDAFIIVGSLLAIGLNILIQMRAGRAHQGDPAAMMKFLTDRDGLVQMFGRNFPPSVWASRALIHGFSVEGMLHLILLAGVSAGAFLGIVALSERLFYQGAIGLSEIAAKRRALSAADMEKRVSSGRHPVRAIFLRELRLMNRTPIFLMNGVLVVIMIPVLFLVMAGSGGPLSILKRLGEGHPGVMVLGLAAFLLVCACLNGTASSAVSREGKHFWISKVIPVPWARQLQAKLMHSYLVALLGIAAGVLVAAIVLKVQAATLVLSAVLALAGAAVLNLIALRIDLARPLLTWTDPQQAIKQNLNVIFASAANLAFIAACGFLAHFLMKTGLSWHVVYALLLAVVGGLAAGLWRELASFAEKKYPAIEG